LLRQVFPDRPIYPTLLGGPSSQPVVTPEERADPRLREVRMQMAGAVRAGIAKVARALGQGLLWPREAPSGNGAIYTASSLDGDPRPRVVESGEQRETRLRRLIDDMAATLHHLQGTLPLPPDVEWQALWNAREVGNAQTRASELLEWLQRQRNRATPYYNTTIALFRDPIPAPAIARVRLRSAIATGFWLVVPDPDRRPMDFSCLTGFQEKRGVIVDVQEDEFGCFYNWKGRHHLDQNPCTGSRCGLTPIPTPSRVTPQRPGAQRAGSAAR
jgi:hypothetical protein